MPVVLSAVVMDNLWLWLRLSISHVKSTMAESTSTYVSELVKNMKSYVTTETDEETLIDLAVVHVADAAAEKLGLKQGNST